MNTQNPYNRKQFQNYHSKLAAKRSRRKYMSVMDFKLLLRHPNRSTFGDVGNITFI